MRNLITGGAGFIGSHLVDSLMKAGEYVICLDNFYTGNFKNIQNWENHPNFLLIEHDVALPIQLDIDRIWHFACPGSPFQYQRNPIKTSKSSFNSFIKFLIELNDVNNIGLIFIFSRSCKCKSNILFKKFN